MDDEDKLQELGELKFGSTGLPRRVVAARDPNSPVEVMQHGLAPGLVEKPHIDALLSSGYVIAYRELTRLMRKSATEPLSPGETAQYEKYVKSLKQLAAEEREQRRADQVERMGEDDLRRLAAQALGLETGDGDE